MQLSHPSHQQPALTAEQKRAILSEIRELTNHGKHLEASILYNTHFPL